MTKTELVSTIAEAAEITKKEAEVALQTILKSATESLVKGDSLTLVGFGTFSVSERAARTGRNPQTGKAVKIPAKKVVKFKAGKQLAETVN